MGLDVSLYAECPGLTWQQKGDAEVYVCERLGSPTYGDSWLESSSVYGRDDLDRVYLQTLSRYYGPCYERGDWPSIYGYIRILQKAFTGYSVFYSSDCQETGTEVTAEFLEGLWQHYLGPNGRNYYKG